MNNKDLIKQYIDTGIKIPETQYEKLSPNEFKTYGRKRIIAHNMHANQKYSPYKLDFTELLHLKPYLDDLPEIDRTPFDFSKAFYRMYSEIFPDLLDNIPDEVIADFHSLRPYEVYRYLSMKPELIKYFKDRLDEIENYQVTDLLETRPELYPYLSDRLKKLRYFDVEDLVRTQPKLFKPLLKDGFINSYNLVEILKRNSDLYNELPNTYFDDKDVWDLKQAIEDTPSLVDNKAFVKAVKRLKPSYKSYIITTAPEIIKHLDGDFEMYEEDAIEIMEKNPKLIKPILNKMTYFTDVISRHPEYYNFLTPENKQKVRSYTILDILIKNPKIIKNFKDIENQISTFDYYDMEEIVRAQPKLLDDLLKINGGKLNYRQISNLRDIANK